MRRTAAHTLILFGLALPMAGLLAAGMFVIALAAGLLGAAVGAKLVELDAHEDAANALQGFRTEPESETEAEADEPDPAVSPDEPLVVGS